MEFATAWWTIGGLDISGYCEELVQFIVKSLSCRRERSAGQPRMPHAAEVRFLARNATRLHSAHCRASNL